MTYEQITKDCPRIDLFRGIRMKYKGKEMYFPSVYIGETEMDDFDLARSSMEYKNASEDKRESVATRKAMTLCSRVLLKDGYAATDEEGNPLKKNMRMSELHAKRELKRNRIEAQIAETEDEDTIATLEASLEALPELEMPEKVFPNEDTVLSFSISNMSGKGTLPADNKRMLQAFAELNYFEQEEVADFTSFPS